MLNIQSHVSDLLLDKVTTRRGAALPGGRDPEGGDEEPVHPGEVGAGCATRNYLARKDGAA
jgi:hypothetical protein